MKANCIVPAYKGDRFLTEALESDFGLEGGALSDHEGLLGSPARTVGVLKR